MQQYSAKKMLKARLKRKNLMKGVATNTMGTLANINALNNMQIDTELQQLEVKDFRLPILIS